MYGKLVLRKCHNPTLPELRIRVQAKSKVMKSDFEREVQVKIVSLLSRTTSDPLSYLIMMLTVHNHLE